MQTLNNPSSILSNTTDNGSFAETSPTRRTNNNDFLSFRAYVTLACGVADVDQCHWILLHLVRMKNRNTVAKLENRVNGVTIFSSSLVSVLASASPTSVTVQLKVDIKLLLDTHLLSVPESADDTAVMNWKCFLWYRAVGSCQLHAAVLQLKNKYLRKWFFNGRSLPSIRRIGQKNTDRWKESKTNNRNNDTLMNALYTVFS